MKITDYIVNPVMETDNWISKEQLELHIKFVSSEVSEAYYYRMAEWVNEHFVVDFLKEYSLEAQSRDKYVASAKKFLEIYEQEMKKHGNTTFSYGATKKTPKFPSKKSVQKETEKLNFMHSDENKDHRDTIRNILAEQISSKQKIFEKIIEVEKDRQIGFLFYDASLDFSIFHQFENLMKGEIVFEISTYSLGEHLEVAAELLKQYLLEFCEKFPEANGFVTIGNWSDSYGEERKYFEEVPSGKVIDEEGREYWIDSWMDIHYIDELAWVNIFPKRIGEKLKEVEKLERSPVCKFSVKDGLYILESQKSIKEHRRKLCKEIYPCFEECLRPGFSTWRLAEIRPFWEDLYFPESHYRIEGKKVYFSRGSFDFVTKTEDVSDETLEDESFEEELFFAAGPDWYVRRGPWEELGLDDLIDEMVRGIFDEEQ